MLGYISACHRCKLHIYQTPLLDQPKKNAIMVVGISAKQLETSCEIPLDNHTKSGQLIASMEKIARSYCFEIYRTNLVKCPPLNRDLKIRYPTQTEIEMCFNNILYEINMLQPHTIILLGNLVQSTFRKKLKIDIEPAKSCTFSFQKIQNRYYVASYHPSYVMRSTLRKEQYLENFSILLEVLSKREE